jgi:signal transduction histidine kinase
MRIRYKVALVGGIPIAIAAAFAFAAWLLLNQAERARDGAVLAGAIYRNSLVAIAARDDFVESLPLDRARHGERFQDVASRALRDLASLGDVAREQTHRRAAEQTRRALVLYVDLMTRLAETTAGNDRQISDMASRAAALISLTDKARERQRASNADIIASLTERDKRLRFARDVVDRAHELRAAIAAVALQSAALTADPDGAERKQALGFGLARLRNAAADLGVLLRADTREEAARQLEALAGEYIDRMGQREANGSGDALAEWADRLFKVNSTEQRAQHEEVAQLLTYSVQAGETEQATQNIAIATLKLGRSTADALASRNAGAAESILDESRVLGETVASLPISPLIQAEMTDALAGWRDSLATTAEGLRRQNAIIGEMDSASVAMMAGASSLNDMFTSDADAIGQFIRNILLIGAAVGLLFGTGTALVVARSITRPLKNLQERMLDLAADPLAGPLVEHSRPDELGDMARAANFFVTEIGRREKALRRAKESADITLVELRQAQSDLIQAEKLASLGQLVAGVAHEINTPLGIALTTSTVVTDEVRKLNDRAISGSLPRSDFLRSVDRLGEGARLIFSNLTRAADLVHSFKQVAADQASGERRRFDMKLWIQDLLTSLGPALRKAGHEVVVECRAGLTLDTYPGALAQVLTNLVMNALTHAYGPETHGTMRLTVSEPRSGAVRIVFEDDGAGIPATHLAKVFDPFFTTRRERGSTGLGLHIVYNLVTGALQGRIELDSAAGRGARFVIDLPSSLADSAVERAHAAG